MFILFLKYWVVCWMCCKAGAVTLVDRIEKRKDLFLWGVAID